MYQFSRGMFRELTPMVERRNGGRHYMEDQLYVLHACEGAVRRLATDRHYFARPARTLFADVRCYFPVARQQQVYSIIERYIAFATSSLRRCHRRLRCGGEPAAVSRADAQGTACQRTPLAHNGYCPSHQHLAETEHAAPAALAA